MSDFRFHSPQFLLILVALPLLALLFNWLGKKNNNILLKFVAAQNLKKLLSGFSYSGSLFKKYCYAFGLILLVLALARPQANPKLEERDNASLDIMVLLDVSRSMDAEDLPPSRLKKAKKTIGHLMDLLSGDRVGIIAFAGSAVLVSPLTSDYDMVKTFLQNVDTSIIQNQGTNLQTAFATALKAMERGSANAGTTSSKSQVFILMSDGEDHHSSELKAVDEIRKKGGVVFSIAYGTEKGVPIPLRNERGELAGYKLDASRQPVISKVEPRALQEAASLGGGQFYFSTLDEGETQDILARIQDMQRDGTATLKAKIYEEYFFPLLCLGVFFLLLAFDSYENIFKSLKSIKKIPLKKKSAAAALILSLFYSAQAMANPLSFLWEKEKRISDKSAKEAKDGKLDDAVNTLKSLQAENPDAPELNYNIGTYLVENKKYQEGREQLHRTIQKDNPLQKEALFNLAGSYAQEGKKDEAKASYAELVDKLTKLEKPSDKDVQLLAETKKNLRRLADPKNDQQNQQNQNQQNSSDQDKKEGEGKDNKENKDQGQGDKDQKKDEDKKDQDKKDEEKKNEEQKNEQNKPQPGGQKPQNGRQPFKERENMSEDDAKRIMEALKQQESRLQKSFLKKKDADNNGNDDQNPKDW